ncbi:MAG TPA: non-homologous end-joining DNA ligase [Candidatus Dormibacteraeota bacterium]|nr:non-homologous end-joining DNA ligase [Candidatus Dormibacteraeota bacterium]
MLATRVAELPEGPDWEYEVKWDGYRIQAIKEGSTIHLFSRRGATYTDKFKTITKAATGIQARSAVLDGEVIALGPEGQPSFQVLQNRGKLPSGYQLVFYVFDLLFLNGKSLLEQPLSERRSHLPAVLAGTSILFSSPLNGTPAVLMKAVRKHNLEGIVAKRKDSRYEPGRRSPKWQKLPLKPKQEFVIGGYRPEAETLELLLVGYYEKGKLLFAGKARQGLNPKIRKDLLDMLKPLATRTCPFTNLPTGKKGHWGEGVTAEDMANYVWVHPELVAEIKFTEWTTGNVLRHAEFAGLRDDKVPTDVVREQPV